MAKKNQTVGFRLRKVTTEQFALIESSYVEHEDTDLRISLKFGRSTEEEKVISVYFGVQFVQHEAVFLVVEVGGHFELEDEAYARFRENTPGKLVLPADFLRHLTMLTIGTARGVLHAKTENTELNHFLIPTINVNEIVIEDITLD